MGSRGRMSTLALTDPASNSAGCPDLGQSLGGALSASETHLSDPKSPSTVSLRVRTIPTPRQRRTNEGKRYSYEYHTYPR